MAVTSLHRGPRFSTARRLAPSAASKPIVSRQAGLEQLPLACPPSSQSCRWSNIPPLPQRRSKAGLILPVETARSSQVHSSSQVTTAADVLNFSPFCISPLWPRPRLSSGLCLVSEIELVSNRWRYCLGKINHAIFARQGKKRHQGLAFLRMASRRSLDLEGRIWEHRKG